MPQEWITRQLQIIDEAIGILHDRLMALEKYVGMPGVGSLRHSRSGVLDRE